MLGVFLLNVQSTGISLAEYMSDFNIRVSVETVYEVKKIDIYYFIEE